MATQVAEDANFAVVAPDGEALAHQFALHGFVV
jgi:hypothetical protein